MIPGDRVCSFHPGQVWESKAGHLWRVESVAIGGQAVFRQGEAGEGRRKRKEWDAVNGWVLHSDPMYPAHNGGGRGMSEIVLGVLRMPDELFWSDDPLYREQHNAIRKEAAAELMTLHSHRDRLSGSLSILLECLRDGIEISGDEIDDAELLLSEISLHYGAES